MAAVVAAPMVLLGCGGDEGGAPTLTWYINPDNGGQAELAKKCGDESNGAYRIETQILPNEADQQREQLVRRLAADDPSVDLMSLDLLFVAEFANAGYLLPITEPGRRQVVHKTTSWKPRSPPCSGTTDWWRPHSGPTRSCCGTASRSPRQQAWIPRPTTSRGIR